MECLLYVQVVSSQFLRITFTITFYLIRMECLLYVQVVSSQFLRITFTITVYLIRDLLHCCATNQT